MTLPLQLRTGPNERISRWERSSRVRAERDATLWAIAIGQLRSPEPPVLVTLTRHARRDLDDDNLEGAFKAVRDAVASWLNLDDRPGSGVSWAYTQSMTRHAHDNHLVTIEIAPLPTHSTPHTV